MVKPISKRSTGRLKSERTMLCGSIRTGSQTDVKMYGRTDSWTNVQIDRREDLSKSDTVTADNSTLRIADRFISNL